MFPIFRQRLFSTIQTKKPSLVPRLIGFTLFSGVISTTVLSYTLITNEKALFWSRDHFPKTINIIAPYLGLPQEISNMTIEEEKDDENQFTDIKQVVGDEQTVAIKFSSGRSVILTCSSDSTITGMKQTLLNNNTCTNDENIIDVTVLDKQAASELLKLSPEELSKRLNQIKIPEIPEKLTEHTLQVALELCRHNELELEIRLRLASTTEYDRVNIQNALKDIEERKKEIKELLKIEVSKLGVRSIFRRRY